MKILLSRLGIYRKKKFPDNILKGGEGVYKIKIFVYKRDIEKKTY